jgi:type III pantothenate kinase
MVLLIDIGNSNIVIAQYKENIGEVYRFNTVRDKSFDEYYLLLKDVIKDSKMMVISSVVPELNRVFKAMAEKFDIETMFVGPGVKTGVQIKIDNPKELGTDIVCDHAGGFKYYFDSCIVVDMGTATTISLSINRVIRGVSIGAGLITSKEAIVGKASQLSQFDFKIPSKAIGTNTIDSLNNGLLLGHSFMIKGIVERIKKENDVPLKVIVTGGASRYMKGLLPNEYIFDENLLIKGLLEIYRKNCEKC